MLTRRRCNECEGKGYFVDFGTQKFSCLTCNGTGNIMKLEELGARLGPSEYSGAQRLSFKCPTCRQRVISIDIWAGKPSNLEYEAGKKIRLWHAEQGPQRDWATLTITPSIDSPHGKPADSGCTGWHGFVTSGKVA